MTGQETDDEEVMKQFGIQYRNAAGQMVVDFAKRMGKALLFQEVQEHRFTYKTGGWNANAQAD